MQAEAWKGGELALKMKRLRAAFDKKNTDGSGFLDSEAISVAPVQSGRDVNHLHLRAIQLLLVVKTRMVKSLHMHIYVQLEQEQEQIWDHLAIVRDSHVVMIRPYFVSAQLRKLYCRRK